MCDRKSHRAGRGTWDALVPGDGGGRMRTVRERARNGARPIASHDSSSADNLPIDRHHDLRSVLSLGAADRRLIVIGGGTIGWSGDHRSSNREDETAAGSDGDRSDIDAT